MQLDVNGARLTADVPPNTALVRYLRDRLGLRGVRTGCSMGECGACTVLVDGESVRSCITPVESVDGKAITTPEGLGGPGEPGAVQGAFLDAQAAQCGYCVNGIIMTVEGLRCAQADEARLLEALEQHICRCGTHVRILSAARRALGLPDAGQHSPGTCVDTVARRSVHNLGSTSDAEDGGLPSMAASQPRVERWLSFGEDGGIVIHPGKVEIGQGIGTAFMQIVALNVGVDLDAVRLGEIVTGSVPDQRYTSSSESIQEGGTALAFAATAFRRLLIERTAAHIGRSPEGLDIVGGMVLDGNGARLVSVEELSATGPVTGDILPVDRPRWTGSPLGEASARHDLPRKLTGSAAFLHDETFDGMVHARAVLPTTPDAKLIEAPVEAIRQMDGVVDVLVDGRLIIVVTEQESEAVQAAERLRRVVRWDPTPINAPASVGSLLRDLPSEPFVVRVDEEAEAALADPEHVASYEAPYQAHASVAPSAAIARFDGGRLEVWTHAQGIYPLQRELTTLLGLDADAVRVAHIDGPGCYGMNGADDAAALAAVAASAVPGRPVRFQFSTQDEFTWEPYGPAMVVDVAASLDHSGRIRAWRHHAISDVHKTRPNGRGDRLVAAWLRDGGTSSRPWPGPEEGGARNASPLYDIPAVDVVANYVRGPVRTSALRCLGAYVNVFAAESFMDELAALAERDPVEFRLAHLDDPRARAVLELAAGRAGWRPHQGPSGRGIGVAVAHYKDSRAYVAQVAEVRLDSGSGEFAVERIVIACDAGTIINEDGLCNQLEGGTLQGLSRALYEESRLGPQGILDRDWTTYRTLRFSQVPKLDIELVSRPGDVPLGVGEAATPVVPAAIANAIYDAIGIRLRRLPLSAAQMEQRLLEMGPEELEKVRL